MKYELVIFDMDGTVIKTRSGQTFKQSPDDWVLITESSRSVRLLQEQRIKVGIATNQAGVAYGYHSRQEMETQLRSLAGLLGLAPGMVKVCYDHPDATLPQFRRVTADRKPGPGMLLALMHEQDVSPEQTLMVGDRPEDEGAAEAAGCDFSAIEAFNRMMRR